MCPAATKVKSKEGEIKEEERKMMKSLPGRDYYKPRTMRITSQRKRWREKKVKREREREVCVSGKTRANQVNHSNQQ